MGLKAVLVTRGASSGALCALHGLPRASAAARTPVPATLTLGVMRRYNEGVYKHHLSAKLSSAASRVAPRPTAPLLPRHRSDMTSPSVEECSAGHSG